MDCHDGTAAGTTAPTSEGSRAKSRSYPAATIAPPTVGVTIPSVAQAASSERESIDANSPETSVKPRGKALTRESSEEGTKSAEARVARLEERPHGLERHPEREHHLAAHGAERVHDAPDWTCGVALPAGPMLKNESEPSPSKVESSEAVAV